MLLDIRPIRTDADLAWALGEVERYFDNEPAVGTPESDRFDVLSTLIESYERQHHPIKAPTPLGAIEFHMDQHGLSQSDLAHVLGSRSRASEVLAGKRPLGLSMIKAIRTAWGIPADLLVGETVAA